MDNMNILSANKLVLCGALCSTLFLMSCSSTENYLEASTLPPIVVPEGFDNKALGELYAVPEGDGRVASGELKRPLPPTLSATQAIEPRIQTLGDRSWLLIPKEAAATWSQLLLHLQSRRISAIKRDVFEATIDTSWVTEAAAPNAAFRYQLRLEPGLQPEFTEIHAVNVQGTRGTPVLADIQWPERSDDAAHKQWFLKEIAKGISKQKAIGDSLIASSISFAPKVISSSVAGEPVLNIDLDAERTRNALQASLKENDFVVYDESQTAGVFHVNKGKNSKKEKKKFGARLKSFLDRIASAKLTRKGLVTNSTASAETLDEILVNLPDEDAINALFPDRIINSDGPTLANVPGYLIVQRLTSDNKQRLYVRTGAGRLLEPSKAKQLLDDIKQQLF